MGEEGFSPEELRALGLAGRGGIRLPALPRGGLPEFFRGARPRGREFLRVLIVAWLLAWVGGALIHTLTPTGLSGADRAYIERTWRQPPFGENLRSILESVWERPFPMIARALNRPWSAGFGVLAFPFCVFAGFRLFVRGRRAIGVALLAAALLGIAFAVAGEASGIGWTRIAIRIFPGSLLVLGGSAVSVLLLLRAASPREPGGWPLPALLLTALLSLNAGLLAGAPDYHLVRLFGMPATSGRAPAWFVTASEWGYWSSAVLGGLLVLVPALVVGHGRSFVGAVRLLGRAVKRRPFPLFAAHLLLAILVLLPVGAVARAALGSGGLLSPFPSVVPGSMYAALAAAVDVAIFVYGTVLCARGLVAATGPNGGEPADVPLPVTDL